MLAPEVEQVWISQHFVHIEPIFRLLLKVAVYFEMRQCESIQFFPGFYPNRLRNVDARQPELSADKDAAEGR